MAATPIAMPSADSAARSFRVRSPTRASRARSVARSRAAAGACLVVVTGSTGPPVSDTIRPSSIRTCRCIRAATASSWVTTMIVVPAVCSSASRSRMAAPVAWSRLPVGSSASTIAGDPASARAMATRCRSPPDSWVGRARSLWPSPTRSSAVAAASRRAAMPAPAYSSPSATLSSTRGVFGQEELLEHEADLGRPEPGQRPVAQRGHVQPGDPHRAAGRPVQRAGQVQQGAFPGPGRAEHRDQFPGRDGQAHPAQRLHRRGAGIDLGHLGQLQDQAISRLPAGLGRGGGPHGVLISPAPRRAGRASGSR